MKQSSNNPASIFSSLRGDAALRLVWLLYLAASATGCITAFYGVVFMRVDFFAIALGMSGVGWLLRHGLRDRLADLEAEMDGFDGEVEGGAENEAGCSERTRAVVVLLKEWDGAERLRGTPKFDPWALQSLRGEIREAVRNDPELEQLFCPRE